MARPPAEVVARPRIDIDAIDGRKYRPAAPRILGLVAGHPAAHHGGRIGAQRRQVLGEKRRGGADDIAAETQCRGALGGQQMRAHHILDIDAAEQEFVGLGVVAGEGLALLLVVVFLREKARGSERDAGQALVAMGQLAQILGGGLGDAIDVLRHRNDVFGHPGRRRAGRRHQRVAEQAGGAGVDEGVDAGRHRLFQQVERAGDVGVDEILPAVGGDMGLVQRGRAVDGAHAPHAARDDGAVGDRAGFGGEGRGQNVEADHFVAAVPERAHQRLAEMAGASCDQNLHPRHPFPARSKPTRT